MKFGIYSIHDSKAKAFFSPVFMHAEGQCLREFTDACNDPEHAFGRNPQDYTLFYLGDYDDNSREIIPATKRSIANGVEVLNPEIDDDQEQAHGA